MEPSFITDPTLLGDAFKQGMRRLAATVTIITLRGEDAQPWGMTATAVTSLSADPYSLLACVNRSSRMHGHLTMGAPFCVNLLSEGHDELSFAFGGRLSHEERFGLGGWELGDLPYLKDAQANFACTVDALFDYGTHSIVVGRIGAIRMPGEFAPLVYGDGRFLPTRAGA
jgi:flavin reductase (DIM6/NTAB) family NADH-FMN oxidoreductase RutF